MANFSLCLFGSLNPGIVDGRYIVSGDLYISDQKVDGLDRYYGLLELAVEAGVFNAVSTRIELPDGTKTFGKTINNDPEKYFTPEVMEKLDTFAKEKFTYG